VTHDEKLDRLRNTLRMRLSLYDLKPNARGKWPKKAEELGLEFLMGALTLDDSLSGTVFLVSVRGISEFLNYEPAQV